MNETEVFSRPNSEARIHDLEQFTLWAETPGRPNFRSRMTFGERNGAFRLTVFTNFEEAPKVLFVGMSPDVFYEFVERFQTIARGPADQKDHIANLGKADNSLPMGPANMAVRNTLWFGKDAEGVCWLGIEQPGVKNIRFTILCNEWHYFYHTDGRQMTPQEASARRTVAILGAVKDAMSNFIGRIRPPYDKEAARKKTSPKAGEGGPAALSSFQEEDILY